MRAVAVMVDEAVDMSFPTPARRCKAQAVEPIWTLTKRDRWLACELHDEGDDGCEAQVFRNGEFCVGRLFATRTAALAHVDAVRSRLEREGWKLVAGFLNQS